MADTNANIQTWYTEQLRQFQAGRFQAHLANADDPEALYPRKHELSTAAVKVNRAKGWPKLPEVVRAAAKYYYERVEAEDWGSVGVYRVPTPEGETLAVRVTTDGDDGWLEVYDTNGLLLGAGRTFIELIAWAPRDEVREQISGTQVETLLSKKTLWQPPPPPPPEPRFKPGEAVECRWQMSMIWFPAQFTQEEPNRVEVEFDDGSREWLEEDHVRKLYEVRQPQPVLPGMDALSPGAQVEYLDGSYDLYIPATVVERRGNRLLMRQLNQDAKEEWTLPARCRPLTPDEVEPTPPLAVGDYVECRWLGSSNLLKAWITQREGDRLLIEYEDGTDEWTTVGKCRRIVEEEEPAGRVPDIAVGDRVECKYQGGKKYYPGKVSNRRGNRILIDYDDGSREWTTLRMCRKIPGQ